MVTPDQDKEKSIYKRKRHISPVTRQIILRILSIFVFYEKNMK